MPAKKFVLPPEKIVRLIEDQGYCFATDMITVNGHKVGYMYRESPESQLDSGWRFFSGEETQEYIDDPRNLSLYDVNTIANYDPDIILFLDQPIGSAYERDTDTENFCRVPFHKT